MEVNTLFHYNYAYKRVSLHVSRTVALMESLSVSYDTTKLELIIFIRG